MTSPRLSPLQFDRSHARAQATAFLQFLNAAQSPLGERDDLEKEMDKYEQMIAGFFLSNKFIPTHSAIRMPIGDFKCDYAIGDLENKRLMLVEIENAAPDSLFVKKPRWTTYWGNRVEAGISQVSDWIHALKKEISSGQMEKNYGYVPDQFECVVLAGLTKYVDKSDRDRLRWRSAVTQVDGVSIRIDTFDSFANSVLRTLG